MSDFTCGWKILEYGGKPVTFSWEDAPDGVFVKIGIISALDPTDADLMYAVERPIGPGCKLILELASNSFCFDLDPNWWPCCIAGVVGVDVIWDFVSPSIQAVLTGQTPPDGARKLLTDVFSTDIGTRAIDAADFELMRKFVSDSRALIEKKYVCPRGKFSPAKRRSERYFKLKTKNRSGHLKLKPNFGSGYAVAVFSDKDELLFSTVVEEPIQFSPFLREFSRRRARVLVINNFQKRK